MLRAFRDISRSNKDDCSWLVAVKIELIVTRKAECWTIVCTQDYWHLHSTRQPCFLTFTTCSCYLNGLPARRLTLYKWSFIIYIYFSHIIFRIPLIQLQIRNIIIDFNNILIFSFNFICKFNHILYERKK